MTIQDVAALAKIRLTPEEEAPMVAAMEAMSGFARALQQVDTTDVPMTAHVIPAENVLREDQVVPSMPREALLAHAATRTEDSISVPRTFD